MDRNSTNKQRAEGVGESTKEDSLLNHVVNLGLTYEQIIGLVIREFWTEVDRVHDDDPALGVGLSNYIKAEFPGFDGGCNL